MMGCICVKEERIVEPAPLSPGSITGQRIGSGSGESIASHGASGSGSSRWKSRMWIDRTGYRLAEIENRSSNTLLFIEKFREVWKRDLFKLEPDEKMQFPANTRLIDTAETYNSIEVVLLKGEGRNSRSSPPVFIEPLELVRCKHIIVQGQGSKLEIIKM